MYSINDDGSDGDDDSNTTNNLKEVQGSNQWYKVKW